MVIEVVDLPMKNGDVLKFLYVYQTVNPILKYHQKNTIAKSITNTIKTHENPLKSIKIP